MGRPTWMLALPGVLAAAAACAQPENIALGVPCAFSPAPNYAHCTDAGDPAQLTDGEQVRGHFWTQQGAVGWAGAGQAIITLDLGADRPISGLSFSTAAGAAGVEWPKSVTLLTAGDDGLFHEVGDLVALGTREAAPPAEGYAVHRFATTALRTHGRKLALVVFGDPFIFCDEIEVWGGDNAWTAEPLPGEGVADLREQVSRLLTHGGVTRRIEADIAAVRAAAESLDEEDRAPVTAELDAAAAELGALPADYGPGFKAILPLNTAHARVFAALARVWRERGLREPSVWASDPWHPMTLCPPLPGPGGADAARLRLEMMRNETRSVAFTVASPDDAVLPVRIEGLPEGAGKPCVEARGVAWTDTREGEPVAAALLPLETSADGGAVLPVTAGLVRQVWLTVTSRELPPGTFDLAVVVGAHRLPFSLQVFPPRFPERPSLHMGGWDYTNMPHFYEATERNRAALVAMLREYFVDSPWAVGDAMPFGTHDASGAMTAPPDTANFDAWRRLWPDAGRYCVFAAVGAKFQQWPMDAPEFDRAVGDWAAFWDRYMRAAGLDPAQLLVLLVDEPCAAETDAVITAWARAIHASGAKIRVWEDPTHRNMADASPEMIAGCDTLCPNRRLFQDGGGAYRAFFAEQRARGKSLEFYSCNGPMRLLDPYAYCRLQAWDCWRYGAVATHFWSFTDGAGGSSWNEYPQPRHAYTPLFIDAETVTAGKHLEAMREGVEDYEYLVMLDRALQDGGGSPGARARAEALLRELPDRVCAAMPENRRPHWEPSAFAPRADAARGEILRALASLEAPER